MFASNDRRKSAFAQGALELQNRKYHKTPFIVIICHLILSSILIDFYYIISHHCNSCINIANHVAVKEFCGIALYSFPGSIYLRMIINDFTEANAVILASAMSLLLSAVLFLASRRIKASRWSLWITTIIGYIALSAAAGPFW